MRDKEFSSKGQKGSKPGSAEPAASGMREMGHTHWMHNRVNEKNSGLIQYSFLICSDDDRERGKPRSPRSERQNGTCAGAQDTSNVGD